MVKRPSLKVAVGVIKNDTGHVLISLRDAKLHQGGLWEFPGGKIEPGETVSEALARELEEELGIIVETFRPLITIDYDYPDLAVRLHVCAVERFSGEPKSCEGQPFLWVNPENLLDYDFPAANRPIVTAARLPQFYAILDDSEPGLLLSHLNKFIVNGIQLIQARFKKLTANQIETFLEIALPLCHEAGVKLLLNSACEDAEYFDTGGIHLTARHLMTSKHRPESKQWVAASCHTLEELRHAAKIGVDFAVLAPVLPTPTHPGAQTLGWVHFTDLVAQTNLPVYALGGLSRADLSKACESGAQGIAGIRAFL